MIHITGRDQRRSRYPYTRHLKELARCKPEYQELPAWLQKVETPLIVGEWRKHLAAHPDAEYREYVLQGIREGFRIGFQYGNQSCRSAKANKRSAIDNPGVVDDYLAKEVSLGRVLGPLERSAWPGVTINRFGVIPKRHQPGKWRLIVDLSHPKEKSVNDGIEEELCSLKYTSVDEAVQVILRLGSGTKMAKFDLESAYRIVPVHPEDRPLLGMAWREKVYIDTALPFGLRSAPKIFTAVADALQWIFESCGIDTVLHYLDDYIVFGASDTDKCQAALDRALQLCRQLGVPIADRKTEGPATTLVFLGIELDSVAGEIRLPKEKLERLKREIAWWRNREKCTKKELLSLIGQLQHACCVVKAGRSFLRRMIDLSSSVRELHYSITLNKGFQSDLRWWACFLPSWNGKGMMTGVIPSEIVGTITSDASGSWGCGAFSSGKDWFQLKLPESWREVHITGKELLPIVISIALWGEQWRNRAVRCLCDNAAVVAILKSGRCKDVKVMHLMRSLFFFLAHYNLQVVAQHIPGAENGAADALSRNNQASFHLQVPSANKEPSAIPRELEEMLVTSQPDWTSQSWTNSLKSFLARV